LVVTCCGRRVAGRVCSLDDGKVPLDGLHGDRDRAASFGSTPELYDRLRPSYPAALIDDLVALGPASALDVGCGTGKVARALIERGVAVVGVEPDERMARVARGHGVDVEVASFEAWDSAARTFDLLTAGHAWHWVDREAGPPKAASVLRAGGTAALFWNYHALEQSLLDAFGAVYQVHAPELQVLGRDPSGLPDIDPFTGCASFTPGQPQTYRWPRQLTADEWVGMLATFSDHQRLGGDRLNALQNGLHDAIVAAGGVVQSLCGTYVWSARRA
jgi:SAM-dependent methyltransferase